MAGKQIYVDLQFNGGGKVKGLPAAVGSGEAVEFDQFNAALEGIAWKDDVAAASTANINLAAPGASIDGVTMTTGMRFLAKNQTAAAENGIYIWNGSAVVATRAPDMSASAEFNSAVVSVTAGTANDDTTWRQTAGNPTVGSTSIVWSSFLSGSPAASESTAGIMEIATQAETDTGTDDLRAVTPLKLATYAGRKLKYAADIGNASAQSFTLTHNLGTRDLVAEIRRNSGDYDTVEADVGFPTTNTCVVTFLTTPTSAQFRVSLFG